MKERNPTITKGIDTSLIWIYLLLVGIGIVAIFAATYKEGDPLIQGFFGFKTDYSKQFYFFIASIMLAIFILLTDSKFFSATANLWYAFGILLLLLVFPFHTSVKGTESIIRIGGFQFQPAEFCKICVCLALAKYLSRPDTEFVRTRSQLIATVLVVTPALITIAQKETGLALVYFSFFIVMYREGLPSTILIVGFSLAVLIVATLLLEKNTLAIILTAMAVLTIYLMRRQIRRHRRLLITIVLVWGICVGVQRFGVPFLFRHIFQTHQVDRIFSTIGRDMPAEYVRPVETVSSEPGIRKKDPDYNVKQSKIAIGSGRIFGKGLLKGTQTRYDFVPEQRTDFIFCTIGEGFGFTGSIVLLAIYLVLLFRIVAIAERQRSVFSRCYAYGVASVFFFHIVINLAMTVGLAPVIGIPLPFVSYGGTSLLTFTILLFILIRLDADRQMVLR
jgi:rod shape determining protein RodA